MDNLYNSVGLTEELYQNGVHCSGTLRLARGAPKILQRAKANGLVGRGETIFRRRSNTFVICCQNVRFISLVTNAFNAETEQYLQKRKVKRRIVNRYESELMQWPKVVKEYNTYMGGVYHFDQMSSYYSFARRSNRWTKKTTFYLHKL